MFSKLAKYISLRGAIRAKLKGIFINSYEMVSKINDLKIKPNTFIDVGANRGMLSKTINYFYPDCNIYAFEPIKHCYSKLQKLEEVINNFKSFNCALSNYSGTAEFNESVFDYSSSLLKMAKRHKDAFPFTKETSVYAVDVYPLEYFADKMEIKSPTILKLDVQGAELTVMKGAEKILTSIDYILCELSLIELYEGQSLAIEVINYMSEKGFNLIDILELNRDLQKNELMQFDGLFKRNY